MESRWLGAERLSRPARAEIEVDGGGEQLQPTSHGWAHKVSETVSKKYLQTRGPGWKVQGLQIVWPSNCVFILLVNIAKSYSLQRVMGKTLYKSFPKLLRAGQTACSKKESLNASIWSGENASLLAYNGSPDIKSQALPPSLKTSDKGKGKQMWQRYTNGSGVKIC